MPEQQDKAFLWSGNPERQLNSGGPLDTVFRSGDLEVISLHGKHHHIDQLSMLRRYSQLDQIHRKLANLGEP